MGTLYLLFGIQNLVFIGARCGITIFYTVFCCCCACCDNDNADVTRYEDDDHADHLISYKYQVWSERSVEQHVPDNSNLGWVQRREMNN